MTTPNSITKSTPILRDYEVAASVRTDPGCVRTGNEDAGRFVKPSDLTAMEKKGLLAIVADGMGGHSAGEVASNLAVETISRIYYQSEAEVEEALREAFIEANREIHAAAMGNETLHGMGTTCSALVLRNGLAYAAHVGDSRVYMVRDGEIYLMTEDHSAVMEMVKQGIINVAEARRHPDKNVILRALGTNPIIEVSMWEQPLAVRAGDYFLLCSDGLCDLVEDAEIGRAVTNALDLHGATESLIALAKERGGHDNITVAVLSVRQAGREQGQTLRATREMEAAQ